MTRKTSATDRTLPILGVGAKIEKELNDAYAAALEISGRLGFVNADPDGKRSDMIIGTLEALEAMLHR